MNPVLSQLATRMAPLFTAGDSHYSIKLTEQDNVNTLIELYQALSTLDIPRLNERFADDVIFELHSADPKPYVMEARGKEQVLAGIEHNFANTQWTSVTFETLAVQGDLAIAIGTETGRYLSPDRLFAHRIVLEYTFRDGLLARYRGWAWPLPAEPAA